MKKNTILLLAAGFLSTMCSQSENLAENLEMASNQKEVNVTFKNTSGQDLVIAFAQGAASGEQVNQLPWLKYDAKSKKNSWQTPPVPSSNKDLDTYIFNVKKDATITIPVPQYDALVGFRCLVADPVYRDNAMQYMNISSTDSVAYMAFPDLKTSAFLFGNFEAGLTENTPGIWNITAVDYFSMPLQLESDGVTVGFKNGVTAEGMIAELKKLGQPYAQGGTIAPNTSKALYRFFAPSHIPSATTTLDAAIKSQIPLLDSTVTVNYGNYTFSKLKGSVKTVGGTVTGTVSCLYTNINTNSGSPRPVSVNDVTTANSFAGEIIGGTNANNNDSLAQIELGAILSAAICRGVIAEPTLWGDIVHTTTNCPYPWNYYPTGIESNSYSKLIHQYSIDGKNYGFPYDDYFSDEAGFDVVAGQDVTMTILPLKGKMTAKPNATQTKQTGCLVATVPASSIYPKSTNWTIGSIKVEKNMIQAGANPLCELDSKSVVCTFPDYAEITMKIDMTSTSNTNAITFYQNGKKASGISITGMVYNATLRVLTFGQAAAWVGYTPPKE